MSETLNCDGVQVIPSCSVDNEAQVEVNNTSNEQKEVIISIPIDAELISESEHGGYSKKKFRLPISS